MQKYFWQMLWANPHNREESIPMLISLLSHFPSCFHFFFWRMDNFSTNDYNGNGTLKTRQHIMVFDVFCKQCQCCFKAQPPLVDHLWACLVWSILSQVACFAETGCCNLHVWLKKKVVFGKCSRCRKVQINNVLPVLVKNTRELSVVQKNVSVYVRHVRVIIESAT